VFSIVPSADHTNPVAAWDPFAPENAGFYQEEIFDGVRFRWSETAAIMPARLAAGSYRIRIECIRVRDLRQELELRLFLNGTPVPDSDVSILRNAIDVNLNIPRAELTTLAWRCRPFPAKGDSRPLGLPIARVLSYPHSDEMRALVFETPADNQFSASLPGK
jgi:hypothetical protein